MIYFDHNSTTPLDERVLEAMLPYLRNDFGNASSRHEYGTVARRAIERAREQVAFAAGANPAQVIFASGGTEANNLFIKGTAANLKPAQIVISSIEHPCVAKPAQELTQHGWSVRRLAVHATGETDSSDVDLAMNTPTSMVSVMLANNETGVVQDVAVIAEKARNAKAWMHTDAVQAFGKIPVSFTGLNVHAMTISAHKIYGPKGAAALIVDKRLDLRPILTGGGHEKGLRSGTENVAAIVGFGLAAELASQRLATLAPQLEAMRNRLENGLREMGAVIFGEQARRLPNTSYFAFPDVEGETLVVQLDRAGFAVASGSACSNLSQGPSEVLLAMGVSRALAGSAVRVSFGKGNTLSQVDAFLLTLRDVLDKLRQMTAIAV